MDTTLKIEPDQKFAISVRDASFEWIARAEEPIVSKGKHGKLPEEVEKASLEGEEMAEPFKIRDLNMSIPRGSLVAICGPVGSGSEFDNISRPAQV